MAKEQDAPQTEQKAQPATTKAISATKKGHDKVTFDLPVPGSVSEAVDLYGEELVLDYFERSYIIRAQSTARSLIEAGKSEDEIRAEMAGFRPDISRRTTKDPLATATTAVAKMSEEQKAQLRALLAEDGS